MATRYFVMRKKEGKTKYSHTPEVFYTLEEAIESAKNFSDSWVNVIDNNCKSVAKVVVNKQ